MILQEKIYKSILLNSILEDIDYSLNSSEKLFLSEISNKELDNLLSLNEISIKRLISKLGLIGAAAAVGAGGLSGGGADLANLAQYGLETARVGIKNTTTGRDNYYKERAINKGDKFNFPADPSNSNTRAMVMSADEVNELRDEGEKYSKHIKNRVTNDKNANPEQLLKLINIAEKKAAEFYKVQDNTYLKSLFVTSLFSVNKISAQSLGNGSRVASVDKNDREILFYKFVIGKEPSSKKKLTPEELSECQKHNLWQEHENLVKEIKNGVKSKNVFNLWLSQSLFLNIEKYTGARPMGGDDDKVSWCGHMVGYLLMNVYKGSGIDPIKKAVTWTKNKSGEKKYNRYGYASTYKFKLLVDRQMKSKQELVYDYSDPAIRNLSREERIKAIKKVIAPGSLITTGGPWSKKKYGTHFVLVLSVDYDNNSYRTIEGNTSGGGGAMRVKTRFFDTEHEKDYYDKKEKKRKLHVAYRDVHEIREIINLKVLFGPGPGTKTAKKIIKKAKKRKRRRGRK